MDTLYLKKKSQKNNFAGFSGLKNSFAAKNELELEN